MLFVFTCLAGLVLGLARPAFSTHGASALKNIAVSENFYGVDIIDHQAWIVGYYGTILHSSDRGKSWEVQSSPTQSSLFNVRFVSPLKGWIGGSYGTVLHTIDGGKNWRAQPVGTTEHLFAADWLEETHGWLVGSRGTTVRTEDGGRSWSASTLPGDFTFSGIKFISATRGWMVGEFGVIFQTKDGGKSWVKQKSPVEVSFSSGASQNLFALLFTAPTEGYAFGLDGLVLKTRDGSRWEIIRQRESANSAGATDHLFAAAVFNGRIFVVGERGTLLQSDPDTGNWRQVDLQIPRLSLNGIAIGKDGFGLTVGNRGLVLRTEDGGKTWKRLKIDPQLKTRNAFPLP
jgi:photosystem II stability/assembly factor-like uncharacterized protein